MENANQQRNIKNTDDVVKHGKLLKNVSCCTSGPSDTQIVQTTKSSGTQDQYFDDLLKIVLNISYAKRETNDSFSKSYYEQQAESWDIIFRDDHLELYLGTLDAAANTALVFDEEPHDSETSRLSLVQGDGYNPLIPDKNASNYMSKMQTSPREDSSSCDSEEHTGVEHQRWNEFDVVKIVAQVEALVAESKSVPPPPPAPTTRTEEQKSSTSIKKSRDIDDIKRNNADNIAATTLNTTTTETVNPSDDAKNGVSEILKTSIAIPGHDMNRIQSSSRTGKFPDSPQNKGDHELTSGFVAKSTAPIYFFGGLINLCAYDKSYLRSNNSIPVNDREDYIGNVGRFYQRKWNSRERAMKITKKNDNISKMTLLERSFKTPPYLEIKAVDKDTYDISKHFEQVEHFILGNLEKILQAAPKTRRDEIRNAVVSKGVDGITVEKAVRRGLDASRTSQLQSRKDIKIEERHENDHSRVDACGVSSSCKQDEATHHPVARFFIHCVVGSNRSACCACAFLMRYKRWTAKEAIAVVAWKRRCRILSNLEFLRALIRYEEQLREEGVL